MARPWCNVIAGTRYIKSANDELLTRDEGDSSNLFMEVVTYKTAQGRQLCMALATAKHFPRLWMQLCAEPPSSEGGHGPGGVYDDQAARRTTRPHGFNLQPADLIDKVQGTTMKVPYRATSSAPKGDWPILEYTSKWSSPN